MVLKYLLGVLMFFLIDFTPIVAIDDKNQRLEILFSVPHIGFNEENILKEAFCESNELDNRVQQFHIVKDHNEYKTGKYIINVVFEAPEDFTGKLFIFLVSDQSRRWSVEFKGNLNSIEHTIFTSISSEIVPVTEQWHHQVLVMDRALDNVQLLSSIINDIFESNVSTISIRYLSNYIKISIPSSTTDLSPVCNFTANHQYILSAFKESYQLTLKRSTLEEVKRNLGVNQLEQCTENVLRIQIGILDVREIYMDCDKQSNYSISFHYQYLYNIGDYAITFILMDKGELDSDPNPTVYHTTRKFSHKENDLTVRLIDRLFEDLSDNIWHDCSGDSVTLSIDEEVLERSNTNISQLTLRNPSCKFYLQQNISQWTMKMLLSEKKEFPCGFLQHFGNDVFRNTLFFNLKSRNDTSRFTHYVHQSMSGIIQGSLNRVSYWRSPLMIMMRLTEGLPIKHITCGDNAEGIFDIDIQLKLSRTPDPNNIDRISEVSYGEPFYVILSSQYQFRMAECSLSLLQLCSSENNSITQYCNVTEIINRRLTVRSNSTWETEYWFTDLVYCSSSVNVIRVLPKLNKTYLYGFIASCQVRQCEFDYFQHDRVEFCPMELGEEPFRCNLISHRYYTSLLLIIDTTLPFTWFILLIIFAFLTPIIVGLISPPFFVKYCSRKKIRSVHIDNDSIGNENISFPNPHKISPMSDEICTTNI